MKLYGVLGHPVGHSRSPAMHNRAFQTLGLAATYLPFEVLPECLPDAIRGVRALGISGLNVTLPHKTAIMPLWTRSMQSRVVRRGHTVLRDGDRLLGTNTDATGLCRALLEARNRVAGARVTVLGAGGAATGKRRRAGATPVSRR